MQVWSHRAEDLWGLRPEKVLGTHLLNLDIGLPIDMLKTPIRSCLSGEEKSVELVLPTTNRRGKQVSCRVTCAPLYTGGGDIRGVIVVMEEVRDQREVVSGTVVNLERVAGDRPIPLQHACLLRVGSDRPCRRATAGS